ncbi:MAG TPA: hypothetical protein VLC47_09050 [Burkholderiales bacterium]|nr:hypothetical protein [Burkholderiales bacterium]
MPYSKIALGLATGLLAANVAAAAAPAWCKDVHSGACPAIVQPEWPHVVYPEASHVVYPEGVLVFGGR